MNEKKPQQERSRALFQSILEATNQLLEKTADAGLTTRKIAERAGVSVGSLYQYFRNTDSILGEALRRQIENDRKIISEEFDANSGLALEPRLKKVFHRLFVANLKNPKTRGLFFKRAASLGLFDFTRDEIQSLSNELFRKAKSSGEFRKDLDEEIATHLISNAVFAAVTGALLDADQFQGREEDLARELARLVTRYLT